MWSILFFLNILVGESNRVCEGGSGRVREREREREREEERVREVNSKG